MGKWIIEMPEGFRPYNDKERCASKCPFFTIEEDFDLDEQICNPSSCPLANAKPLKENEDHGRK